MSQPMNTPAGTPTPQPSKIGPRILTGITIFLAAVFWLLIYGQLTFLVPATQKVMGDFKMRIPWFTERVMVDSWWSVAVIAVVAIGICLAVRKRWVWNFVLLVLPLVINLAVCLSLLLSTLMLLLGLSERLAAGN